MASNKILQILHNSKYDMFAVENSIKQAEIENNYENEIDYDNDVIHLNNFLKYLILSTRHLNKTRTKASNLTFIAEISDSELELLPAALIQLFILILVILIIFLICKCNNIMKYCRDFKPFSSPFSSTEISSEDVYDHKYNLKEVFCSTCYKFKMKRRFKNRRLRNKRFNRNRVIRKLGKNIERNSSLYRQNTKTSVRLRADSSNLKLSNYTLSGSIKMKRSNGNDSTFSGKTSRLQIQKSFQNSNVPYGSSGLF